MQRFLRKQWARKKVKRDSASGEAEGFGCAESLDGSGGGVYKLGG
jgi:hypothetical protein